MNNFILVALLSCLAASASAAPKCSELSQDIKHDAIKYCQPYIFNLYVSNDPMDKCMQLYYFGNRNGKSDKALALFMAENDAMTIPLSVDVPSSNNMWIVTTEETSPKTLTYYKLFLDDKEHYFCLYACDDKGDYIKSLRCLALDKNGHRKINAKLATFTELPWDSTGQKYMDVYNCTTPRVGGYRLASGSADQKTCSSFMCSYLGFCF